MSRGQSAFVRTLLGPMVDEAEAAFPRLTPQQQQDVLDILCRPLEILCLGVLHAYGAVWTWEDSIDEVLAHRSA